MTEALARSLNVITAQWSLLLGHGPLLRLCRPLWFWPVSGIDLPVEVYGVIKRPGIEDWSVSDLGTNSFGQGLAVTPIQMVNAHRIACQWRQVDAALCRVGTRVRMARCNTPSRRYRPQVKPETAQMLTEFGGGRELGNTAAGVAGYRIAGKSGTAQIPTQRATPRTRPSSPLPAMRRPTTRSS